MIRTDQPLEFHIQGMDCAEEVTLLKRELVPLLGTEDRLGFDLLRARLTVNTRQTDLSEQDILAAIERTGLKAKPWYASTQGDGSLTFWDRHGRTLLTAISGPLALLGLILQVSVASELASRFCYGVAILAGLGMVFLKAWRALVSLRPDMNLLMTIAVVGALLIDEWFEGATVAFLFSLSLLLESWSVNRARNAIAALMDLSPPTAHLVSNGDVVDVPPTEVPVAAVIHIRPGEKIPLDGQIVEGASGVNQAPITGESVPVSKQIGDQVFAGTINGDGLLQVETTKAADDTTLARIIRMVGDASSKRAPSEKWVEKFAAVYTPIVMVLAALVLIVPPLIFGGEWGDWFYRSLVLLVIACPCALVISTPVSVVSGLAAAARNGVLIKGGNFIEVPARLQAIALDKTGTLTRGVPEVQKVVPLNGHDETELFERACALESNSNHPLARAIVAEAQRRNIRIPTSRQVEAIPGKGVTGVIDGNAYWLGSHRLFEERAQETPEQHEQLEALQQAGHSVVVVGNDQHVCGFITLADALRNEARDAVGQLHQTGVKHLIMLTGDNQETAQAIARDAGIDKVRAELLPEDKVQAVERLVEEHEFVAMVGDGVNDAPAMARATLGIAMGAAGSDAAIETADIALMADDISKLPWLIHHSHRTLTIIRQNIAFSLGVKAIFVVLTLLSYASLWAAITADMGASLLVIANGLRLLKSIR